MEQKDMNQPDSPGGDSARAETNATRYCFKCKEETNFAFTYAEGFLVKTKCTNCGVVEQDRKQLAKVFIEDLIDRSFDSLKRETKAALHNPVDTVSHLPKKAIIRSLEEIRRVMNIFKE